MPMGHCRVLGEFASTGTDVAERLIKAAFMDQDHSQVSRGYHGCTEGHPAQPGHGGDIEGRGTS